MVMAAPPRARGGNEPPPPPAANQRPASRGPAPPGVGSKHGSGDAGHSGAGDGAP